MFEGGPALQAWSSRSSSATLDWNHSRSADGYWINVRVEGGNQVGWVSSTPGLTACNVPVGDLPVRQG